MDHQHRHVSHAVIDHARDAELCEWVRLHLASNAQSGDGLFRTQPVIRAECFLRSRSFVRQLNRPLALA